MYRALAWLLPFGLLVFSVVAVPLRLLDHEGLPRYRKLQEQLERVHRDNAQLKRKLARLQTQIRGLKTDPHAVERIARDELGMIRDGEVLFQFSE